MTNLIKIKLASTIINPLLGKAMQHKAVSKQTKTSRISTAIRNMSKQSNLFE
jgi:hypothetical protein